jgi:hypothetical protein
MDVLIKNATKVPKVAKSASDIERLSVLRGSLNVEEALLKPIKALCRRSEEETLEAKRYLFLDLQHGNWLIRIRSLSIIDVLFTRSHRFRASVCDNIREVAVSGFLIDDAAPRSSNRVTNLSSGFKRVSNKVKELLELWDVQFGNYYPVLRATVRFLKESANIKMPDVQRKARDYEERRRQSETNSARLAIARRNQVMSEASRELPEVEEDLHRLEEFFEVLFPDFDNFVSNRALPLAREEQGGSGGPSPKRARLSGDEEEEDVEWEDQDDDIMSAAGAAMLDVSAPAVGALAINPLVLELDVEGSGSSTRDVDQNVLELMRKHAIYLAEHRVPKLQRWQEALVAANVKTSKATTAAAVEELATSQGVNALLRRVALLNVRLKRGLLGRCQKLFTGVDFGEVIG